MEGQIKTLYVFPDTNVFVQCKQLEALDWRELGEYDKVVLIVTRPVITEVDHQKSGSGRLAKRAKLANTLFRKFLQGNSEIEIPTQGVGPILVVALGQNLEPSEELSSELNYSHADDQMVGIAHAYQSSHEHEVVFLSHDTGPLLMAKRVGVLFQQVPDEWLLTTENDEEQKRIKELEANLKRLKEAEPQCTISFNDAPWKFTRLKRMPLKPAQVTELLEILKAEYPIGTDFGPSEASERPGKLLRYGFPRTEKFVPATDEDISNYRDNYASWLESCEAFFREIHDELNDQEEIWVVSTALVNDGGRPADDVIVSFEVTSRNFGLMGTPSKEQAESIQKPLQLRPVPYAPQGRWDQGEIGRHSFEFPGGLSMVTTDRLSSDFLGLPKGRDPNCFYWKGGRPSAPVARVEFECAQWRHQESPEVFDLRLVIDSERKPMRGAILIVVHAANLREPVKKTQSVEFIIQEVDAFSDARALISGSPAG